MYETLMEAAVAEENCQQALRAVKRNQGAAGIDRMTTEELEPRLQANWWILKGKLLKGTYVPALCSPGPTMCRAIVHDPEDATGVVIGRSCHHLLDQPVKGSDAIVRFAATIDSGSVDVQGSDVGPGTTTEVLILDTHGGARPAVLRDMFAATGLNAGLFIGGDHEFIIFQGLFLPLGA
jgi:hypothetical protein